MRKSSPRVVLSVVSVAVIALLGLAACASGAGSQAPGAANGSSYSDLSWEAQALQSIGFAPADVTLAAMDNPSPAPSASAGGPSGSRAGQGAKLRQLRHRLIRFGFGKRLEHGEATVQTDEGTKTVVVQRGAVTAITATSVTVKSADGFTLTWTFGSPFTVIKDRAKIQASDVAVGTEVGIAGAQDGSATDARLMVVAKNQ
jgi:hypothetical protein